jgi:hypothetical protein
VNISENIIIDLLPAYFAKEASAETCALIDAYVAEHPAFAKAMRAAHKPEGHGTHLTNLGTPHPSSAVQAMGRVQGLLRWRSTLMALAIFFSLAPFSFAIQNGQLQWAMLRDAPGAALLYAIAAVIAWGAFVVLKRKMNSG